MKKTSNEAVHLCPICVCVEMDFMERLKTDKHIRIRRFKCSVCDHVEMYLMGGPDDGERTYQNRQSAKETKWQDSRNNEFKSFPGIC
jgi:hypothetical protein